MNMVEESLFCSVGKTARQRSSKKGACRADMMVAREQDSCATIEEDGDGSGNALEVMMLSFSMGNGFR